MWRNVLDFNWATIHLHYFFTATNLWHLVLLEELKVRKWGGRINWNRKWTTNEGVEMCKFCYLSPFMFVGRIFLHQAHLLLICRSWCSSKTQFSYQEKCYKENEPFLKVVGFFFSLSSFHGIFTSFSFSDFKLKQAWNLCSVGANGNIPIIWIIP